MSIFVCPTCQKSFDPATSRTMPFCSDRCRKIDLGRFLSLIDKAPGTFAIVPPKG